MVNPVMCQGCGACAAACPNFAAELNGYASRQMFDIIDAAIQS
jgi:heterodisulfide reductase subunit A